MSVIIKKSDPIYKKVYNELVEQIKKESIAKLSAVSLSKEYNINRNTADKVISLLETNGWVRRIPRKGTFPVKSNIQKINSINIVYSFDSFSSQFLNSYPYVNAKLIEEISKNDLSGQCNINILLIDPTSSYTQMCEKLTALGSRAGFIVLNPENFPQLISLLQKEQMPYMTFSHEAADINRVSHDTYKGAYRAFEHLIKISQRKNIAFLNVGNDASSPNPRIYPRFKAYKDALKDNDIPFDERYVFNISSKNEDIIKVIDALKMNSEIDAIFASSFEVGRAIINAMKLMKIKIPEDVAIIVFYDLPEFAQSSLGITAVRAPLKKMGHAILENLIEMINFGYRDDVRLTFNDELILRDSC